MLRLARQKAGAGGEPTRGDRERLRPGPNRGEIDATLRGELGTILDWIEAQAVEKTRKRDTPPSSIAARAHIARWPWKRRRSQREPEKMEKDSKCSDHVRGFHQPPPQLPWFLTSTHTPPSTPTPSPP